MTAAWRPRRSDILIFRRIASGAFGGSNSVSDKNPIHGWNTGVDHDGVHVCSFLWVAHSGKIHGSRIHATLIGLKNHSDQPTIWQSKKGTSNYPPVWDGRGKKLLAKKKTPQLSSVGCTNAEGPWWATKNTRILIFHCIINIFCVYIYYIYTYWLFSRDHYNRLFKSSFFGHISVLLLHVRVISHPSKKTQLCRIHGAPW